MDHAVRHATVVEEVADDPIRHLVIGPDRSGNLLELIVMVALRVPLSSMPWP